MILGYSAWLLSLHVEGFKDPIWKAWLGWRCVKTWFMHKQAYVYVVVYVYLGLRGAVLMGSTG